MSSRKLFVILLAVVFIIGAVGIAGAKSSYVNSFTSAYPSSATASFSCSICHVPAGPSARNPYGAAYASAGHNFKTIESQDSDGDGATNIVEINAGTNPGDPGSKPVVTPTACTGYKYSVWSACGANGQQTRTVISNTPAGCTGTPPTAAKLTRACTPGPVACTGYTYSAWSGCGANGQQTRTVIGNTPAGCTGTPSTTAKLTRACSPTPPPTIDGTTLYMQRCSSCHGSIQRSQVRGATAADIKSAITGVSEMTFLKFLTDAKIQAIADALVTTTPPPPPPPPSGGAHPDGWLNKHPNYVDRNGTSSCTACHGKDLKGGTGPSCFSCHDGVDD